MSVVCIGCRFMYYVIIDFFRAGELRAYLCPECRNQ